MGVLVVLKFRFAKVIALAVSIGNNLRPIVAKIFGPALSFVIPKDYHQARVLFWVLVGRLTGELSGGVIACRLLVSWLVFVTGVSSGSGSRIVIFLGTCRNTLLG